MDFVELFYGADWVIRATILLLVGMSVFSWTLIIDKLLHLKKVDNKAADIASMLMHTHSLQSIDNFPASPLKNMLMLARNSAVFTSSVENRMIKRLEKETEDLYSKLGVLGAIASSAPFIGLFGTVWGIMNSLAVLGSSGSNQLNIVAPMIGEALFVTAIGFVVAIPASLMYNFINQKIERISNRWFGFIIDTSHKIESGTLS